MIKQLEDEFRKRPFLAVAVSLLLFVVNILYTKVTSQGAFEADGHKFVLAMVAEQKIEGKPYYFPIFKEKTK